MIHLTFILLLFLNLNSIDNIATINKIKNQAQEAFESGNYREAINHYSYLVDSLKVSDDNVQINLAHAYYKLSVMDSAFNIYKKLSIAADNKLRSVANQQLGVIANKQKDKEAALNFFKEALRADPSNEDARYNYELLKKQSDQQQQQKQQDKDQQDKNNQQEEQQNNQDNKSSQDQQNKENQQKENKDQQKDGSENQENEESGKKDQQKNDDGKKNETKDQRTAEPEKKEQQERPAPMMDQQKLQEMNISPEKAKMILDAMRNSEIQYLQQMQKKPTKRANSNKPDW
ncbi:MAG: tetratricopeptide repeat protein [Cytophagales bacterium]|nr:tetratricopeptide repeat protein [Cytophagales bacterium]